MVVTFLGQLKVISLVEATRCTAKSDKVTMMTIVKAFGWLCSSTGFDLCVVWPVWSEICCSFGSQALLYVLNLAVSRGGL